MAKIKGDSAILPQTSVKVAANTDVKENMPDEMEKKPKSRSRKETDSGILPEIVSSDNMFVGTASKDIYQDFVNAAISIEERELKAYQNFVRYMKYEEILWGTMVGVEEEEGHAVVSVLFDEHVIKIRDNDFFEPTYEFAVTYAAMTEAQKLKRRMSMLNFMLGAKVCFTIKDVQFNLERDKYDNMYGQNILEAQGNRIRAMHLVRDIFFFHTYRKTTKGIPRSVKEGDIVVAKVIQVKEESLLVECCGVETRIMRGLLPTLEMVDDCTKYYKSGDEIQVRIKRLYLEDEKVHLSLTGRINNPSFVIRNLKVGSSAIGIVEKHNLQKHIYVIYLYSGVTATVHELDVKGHIPLIVGDKVIVGIKRIYESYVIGSASKI